MTLIEVIDAARHLLNEPLDSTRTFPDNTSGFWTDNQLMVYHNLIQHEVENEVIQAFEDHFVTQAYLNISAGVAEYSLPSTFIKMRRVEDARSAEPVEIVPVTLNHRIADAGLVSDDSAIFAGGGYYIRGNQIVLTDTPTFTNNSAIRLHFIHRLSDVTAASSTSEIPAEHHRILVWGVVKLAIFGQQGDSTLANAEFEKHLFKVKQQVENRQIQRPRFVIQNKKDGVL